MDVGCCMGTRLNQFFHEKRNSLHTLHEDIVIEIEKDAYTYTVVTALQKPSRESRETFYPEGAD
jgi:hypothetical protein